jgi:uncharacterized membrane protein
MSAILLAASLIPWLSPKQFSVDEFRATFDRLMLIVQCFFAYMMAIILCAGLKHPVDSGRAIMGGIFVLFAAMGNLLGKVRRNFFIGIRTPWTLASERVWNATHRFAAKTFVATGLIGLALSIGNLLRGPLFALLILAGALSPVLYSLIVYKQLEHSHEL